jgi:hypothetical protein
LFSLFWSAGAAAQSLTPIHFGVSTNSARCVKTRPPPQDSQADDTIADMTVIGLIEALCDPLHAEDGFVERRHSLLVFGIERQVSDSSRHISSSVEAACSFATRITDRENGVNAAPMLRRPA